MSESDYSIRNGIPVRAGGQIVGRVVEGKFIKRVKASRHQLREPRAWAVDCQSLADAESLGAEMVEIVDVETDVTYSASIARIRAKGFLLDRGFGQQICLPLQFWSVRRAEQLVLALGGIA